MSTPGPRQHDERLSEELVAYLDGELSTSESESVEVRIGQDEHARSELQKFDRVWNALDGLERATVGDSFTKTTIEMAAVEARKQLAHETMMLPVRKRNRWIKIASLATVAALVGFAAIAALLPSPNRQLYANLPVIMELDAYSEVRDIEFLRLLNATSSDWLLSEWGGEIAPRSEALGELSAASYGDRRKYVESLDADARTDLASKHRRYQSLTPELREELTSWHTRLANDPDAAALQAAMLAYYAWVSREDEVDQARLRSLDAAERVERVESMQRWAERQSEMRLSPANVAALRKALDTAAADPELIRRHQQIVDSLPAFNKLKRSEGRRDRRIDGLRALKRSSPRIAILMVEMATAFGNRDDLTQPITDFRDAVEARLIDALDPETAKRLRAMKQQERSRRLAFWLMASVRRPRTPDVATLEDYFVSGNLSAEDQQRLLAMPKDQMLEELEQLYVREFLGDAEGDREFQQMMQDFMGRGEDRGRRWGDRGPRGPNGPRGEGPRGRGPRIDGPRGMGPPPPPPDEQTPSA